MHEAADPAAGAAASPAAGPAGSADSALDVLVPRLRQFAVVAREEHLTRAAELLGVPQPTLSRSIARLEAELGLPLFTRPGRSIRLTRHGRSLLEAAERSMLTLAGPLERLTGETDPSAGRVALGFLHTLGGETVPRLLKDFRARHPLIRFTLIQGSAHGLLARLGDGDIDLCLTSPLPDAPGIRARGLDEQRIDLFVPAGHRLAARRPAAHHGTSEDAGSGNAASGNAGSGNAGSGNAAGVPLAEAADEDFIVMEHGYGLRAITDTLCREAGFEPRITFEGEEVDTARGLVGAGLGVSLLPATTSSLADPSVTAVRVTAPKAARTIGIAWPDDRPLTAPAAAFRNFVLTYAGRLPR
ncbi:MAG TPA: LysR family transcriptional regulator [Trebonia sp.]|nr:LysR family transcriptional regulator [Trebonia sp.]